jgi:non-canonical purine NTP pyrophosphatase (RdgB/HAM1 family)
MTPIRIGTTSAGKLREFRAMLTPLGYTVIGLEDLPNFDVEEDGDTFAANAIKKANTLMLLTGETAIADDSGLSVDALDGAPGVYSARYAGVSGEGCDEANWRKLLEQMQKQTNRAAHFVCALALCVPGEAPIVFEGQCKGTITDEPRGTGGFGYDPIFLVDGTTKTTAEMSPNEKNSVSHRSQALAKLVEHLRHLIRKLVHRGNTVTALSRSKRNNQEQVRWIEGSYDNVSEWQGELDSCDAVVNLAGESIAKRWTQNASKLMIASRVGTTTAIYHALAHCESPPPVLVSASGIGYYGTHAETVFDEGSPMGEGFVASLSNEWEKAARRCEEFCRVTLLRMGLVLGIDGGAMPKLVAPIRSFVGGALGSGQQWSSWIHVEDLTELILFCISNPDVKGPINAVAPNPVRMRELVNTIAKILRRPALLDAPAWVLRLVFGQMAKELLLEGQHVLPKAIATLGFTFQYPQIATAMEQLLVPDAQQ